MSTLSELERDTLSELQREIEKRGVKVAERQGGTICVRLDGFSYGALINNNTALNEVVIQCAISYQDFLSLSKSHPELSNKYVLVDSSSKSVWSGETKGELLPIANTHPGSFLGLAGITGARTMLLLDVDQKPQPTTSQTMLLLDAVEKPPGFDTPIENRRIHSVPHSLVGSSFQT